MGKKDFFRLPVVSAGAEHLVMGYLMRRNILHTRPRQTTKAMTSYAFIPILVIVQVLRNCRRSECR
jgi:hypothetical protein